MLAAMAGERFTRRDGGGFTMIEIAIVLVVVGILLSGAVMGVRPVLDSSKAATTTARLDRIELALLAYVMQNGCLPCPAEGDLPTTNSAAGWSNSNQGAYGPNYSNNQPCATGSAISGTACATNGGAGANLPIGVVPWNNLGLREADIVDGWNSRISYMVDSNLVVTAGTSMVRTLPASYPAGTLSVTNYGASATQTSAAAYVLVSHGKDRIGAFAGGSGNLVANVLGYAATDPQGANMPKNNTGSGTATTTAFRQDTPHPIEGTGTYFDDVVRYRTAPNIIRDCGPGACGNPS
jgi:prepilin-type N-terminal cleavage/methylation domain-containing protein